MVSISPCCAPATSASHTRAARTASSTPTQTASSTSGSSSRSIAENGCSWIENNGMRRLAESIARVMSRARAAAGIRSLA